MFIADRLNSVEPGRKLRLAKKKEKKNNEFGHVLRENIFRNQA